MGTGKVLSHIWAPEGCRGTCSPEECPGTYGHQKGARAHMGTRKVPGNIWAPEWCPDKYRHRKGARGLMETEMEPEHIWALKGGACAHKYTLQMPGYLRAT